MLPLGSNRRFGARAREVHGLAAKGIARCLSVLKVPESSPGLENILINDLLSAGTSWKWEVPRHKRRSRLNPSDDPSRGVPLRRPMPGALRRENWLNCAAWGPQQGKGKLAEVVPSSVPCSWQARPHRSPQDLPRKKLVTGIRLPASTALLCRCSIHLWLLHPLPSALALSPLMC